MKNLASIGRSSYEAFTGSTLRHAEFISASQETLKSLPEDPFCTKSTDFGKRRRIQGDESMSESHSPDSNPDLHNSFAQQTVKDLSPLTFHFSRKNPPQPSLTKGGSKVAFTLAEVLITLGIIGVVAALTMPTLITQHRKQVIETRLAKFYSVMSQAIKMSENENGNIMEWESLNYETNEDTGRRETTNGLEWYNKYLSKYLNTLKVEETDTAEKSIAVYFNDGSLLLFSSNSWIFYPDAKDFKKLEDENGVVDRYASVSGKKYFTFYFKNGYCPEKGLIPYGQCYPNMTEDTIKSNPEIGCKESVTNERALCTLLIARNGWKIPKDYPLKF